MVFKNIILQQWMNQTFELSHFTPILLNNTNIFSSNKKSWIHALSNMIDHLKINRKLQHYISTAW